MSWIDEFGILADELWASGLDVVSDVFGRAGFISRYAPNAVTTSLIAQNIELAMANYLDLVKALVERHAFNGIKDPIVLAEINKGGVVQYGDVRGLLVQLGGGSADPEVSLMGGVTTGMTMKEYLRESGVDTNQKIWLYGWEEEPRRTFNGHLQMDGLVFEHWDDNGLIISPQDRWLRRNYYAPGDHWGCACVVAPYFPNMGEPFMI